MRTLWGPLPAEDCNIVIPDPHISRQHAALVQEGARWRLEDLSGQGTAVAGQPFIPVNCAALSPTLLESLIRGVLYPSMNTGQYQTCSWG